MGTERSRIPPGPDRMGTERSHMGSKRTHATSRRSCVGRHVGVESKCVESGRVVEAGRGRVDR